MLLVDRKSLKLSRIRMEILKLITESEKTPNTQLDSRMSLLLRKPEKHSEFFMTLKEDLSFTKLTPKKLNSN
jgi:hypothetical protein